MNLLLQKLFSALLVAIAVSIVVFLLIHLIPGDPVDVILGESAQAADRSAMRQALGLDKPLLVQLYDYAGQLLSFDLGHSLFSKQAISSILAERFPATILLTLSAMLVAILVAIPLGILSAIRKDRVADRIAMGVSLTGMSVPNFLLGPLLILLFAIWLGWLPVSGSGDFSHLILPAVTLGFSMAAILSRMVRSSLLESLQEDFVRTAHAKGVPPSQVVWRHAMANAWLPVITVLGAQFGALLGGAVVTEIVFDWPGIGSLMIESIQKRDYPVVQACVLIVSLSYVLVNTLTDLVYAMVDPRIRFTQ
ncbi:MAG: ABC transporter permease [Chromatiales bacterium]|jgi:peptide/nickel transport system permease protein